MTFDPGNFQLNPDFKLPDYKITQLPNQKGNTVMASPVVSEKRLTTEITAPISRLTFHHPPLNVIDFQMMDELLEAIQTLDQHTEVSVVILSGGERAFSAGVDVAIHTPDKIGMMFQKFHGVIGALAKCRKITIAEVHGVCLGGGAELAMICD